MTWVIPMVVAKVYDDKSLFKFSLFMMIVSVGCTFFGNFVLACCNRRNKADFTYDSKGEPKDEEDPGCFRDICISCCESRTELLSLVIPCLFLEDRNDQIRKVLNVLAIVSFLPPTLLQIIWIMIDRPINGYFVTTWVAFLGIYTARFCKYINDHKKVLKDAKFLGYFALFCIMFFDNVLKERDD
ncbi:hypothetical protein RclHR1_14740002 [Rhizophagus clarus]|uniref:Uncharacterized protein n=1 Tax=Rhizophagus clarus TaxID=94130 RepID=A0A2Z6QHS4_9GLOM|nr:hypothetical protein RclHR1_14740002 [Rhizophagus clarus]